MAVAAPFPVDRRRTAIAIAWQNNNLIADEIMRRVRGGARFTWRKYRIGEAFRIPDTRVGRASRPNEVEFGFDEFEGATQDYGLEDPIPQKDIDNAPTDYDPLDNATTNLTNLVMLDRERRVANVVFNPANHANTITLAGTSQFSDPASDPITVIGNLLDAMVMRANTMVLGRTTFTALARHPAIVAAYHANEGGKGIVPREFIAKLFEMDRVFVGSAWADYTRRGQAPTRSRLWNQHLGLLHLDFSANLQNGVTWGMTVQNGSRVTMRWEDRNIGLKGGQRVRVGEEVEEIVTAPELGALIINATA